MNFEILQYEFFQRAIIASVLISVVAGIIGTIIVVKKMALVTESVAHSAFGGLGMAYFFKFPLFLGALISGVISAILTSIFRERAGTKLDSILNIIWSVGMSVGLIFVFMTPGYSSDLMSYLFGNILLVGWSDIWMMLVLDIIIILIIAVFFNTILATIYNEEFARLRNIKTRIIYGILFVLIALSVVSAIRMVGSVLLIALFTIPAVTARLFLKSLRSMMVISASLTLFTTISGLFLSYFINLPTGPVIVILSVGIYMLSRFLQKIPIIL